MVFKSPTIAMVAENFAVECQSDDSHFIQPIILRNEEYLTEIWLGNLINKRKLALLKPNVLYSESGCLIFTFRLNILPYPSPSPSTNLWR